MKTKSIKHVLLLCTPGFGLVDIWLPVVRKLKEEGNVKIDFLFPEPSALRLENRNSDLFKLAEKFTTNKVIYKGYSGRFFVASTLAEASIGVKHSKIDAKILTFSYRLIKGRLSRYFILKVVGEYLLVVSKYIAYVKENIGNNKLFDFNLLNNVDAILQNVVTVHKITDKKLRSKIKEVPRFSMLGNLSLSWVRADINCRQPATKSSDVTVYSMSHLELNWYKKCFKILEKNIVHVGIPRHDNDWLELIYNQTHSIEEELFDSFVFLIGSPSTPYNTVERKKKALKDIYNVVCVKHKLKIVVKKHPKESLDGIDGHIYTEALGLENYGKNWVYSDRHPSMLGKKAIFSISFYSGVVLDMLAINKPSIEYLNLEGLPLYDNSNSLRDAHGKPVFEFAYTKLVLNASSKLDLEKHVESILSQYEATVLPLRSKYEDYFTTSYDNASEIVANDILKRIDN
jgi:hypothetical protein